ncbi:MAG: hypothetical protein HY716_08825 [Planctomycetes bacterium]|nr:hypothetical protein [Planctomycetota bacterium]
MFPLFVALAVQLVAQDPPAGVEDRWRFEVQPVLWLAWQAKSKVRAMEQEAIAKGGSGHGSAFTYEDVGLDGLSLVPELRASARRGPHAIRVSSLYTRLSHRERLDAPLEYDGDLLAAGEHVRASFALALVEAVYAYEILSDGVRLEIGAGLAYTKWSGSLRSFDTGEESNEVVPAVLLPVPRLRLEYDVAESARAHLEASLLLSRTMRRGLPVSQNEQGMARLSAGADVKLGSVRAGLAIAYLTLDSVSFEHRDEADLLNYKMLGVQVGVSVEF